MGVRTVAVRSVAMRRVRMVAMEDESTAAAFAQAVRGAGGAFGIGGSSGGGLHAFGIVVGGSSGGGLHERGCVELSHRAAQLEEEQHKREHRVAGCTDSNRTQLLAREARGPRGHNGSRSDGHHLNLRVQLHPGCTRMGTVLVPKSKVF